MDETLSLLKEDGHKRPYAAWFRLHEISRKGKLIETESRLLAGGKSGHEGSYSGDENVLKLEMVMDEPLSKCTKNH